MPNKPLQVFLGGQPVGLLMQSDAGDLSFEYAQDATRALSISMPLEDKTFGNDACEAYFGGLLPESEPARKMLGLRFGVNAHNTFSLLRAIGHECAGAVSVVEQDDPIVPVDSFDLKLKVISDKELARHIRELPRSPLFVGVEDLRLSLAGVQDKAAVCLVDGKIALPLEGSPTTHILKPAIEIVKDSVPNEYFCMRVARAMGLNVPPVEMRMADKTPYLLVERYDREFLPDGRLRRIHQEDFCQALGIRTSAKYEAEGGPGLKASFDLVKQCDTPAADVLHLMEMVIVNYLLGNTDAHGKNFSLLHRPDSAIVLAPFYDLLCTQIYEKLTKNMSMQIGGKHNINEVRPEHWEALCKSIPFSYTQFKKLFAENAEQLVAVAEKERAEIDSPSSAFDRMLQYFERHARKSSMLMRG